MRLVGKQKCDAAINLFGSREIKRRTIMHGSKKKSLFCWCNNHFVRYPHHEFPTKSVMIWEPLDFLTGEHASSWVVGASEQSLFFNPYFERGVRCFWRTRRERATQLYKNILSRVAPRAPSRNLFWVVKIKSWSRAPSADEKLFTHTQQSEYISHIYAACAKILRGRVHRGACRWKCTTFAPTSHLKK